MNKPFKQHKYKAVCGNSKFKHVMAISLDPTTNFETGLIRCITSRVGNVEIGGYIDRSELFFLKKSGNNTFEIGNKLSIENEDKIINDVSGKNGDFLGFEDPDIFFDEKTNLIHLFFTMPFINNKSKHITVNLGHAQGKNLKSLVMQKPILNAVKKTNSGAKELSIAPENSKGLRYNLVESAQRYKDKWYSTIRIAIAKNFEHAWKFGKTVFLPYEYNIPWIAEHASPGPLLPRTFLDLGENKLLGIINGREASKILKTHTKYGKFSVGLFVYNYELGKIEWVSKKPLIYDDEATTITFASQFVETKNGEGVLYAHVDDSFVRAYNIYANKIQKLIPTKFLR